jgi:hypothetical protein
MAVSIVSYLSFFLLDVVLVDWLQQVVAHIGTMAVDDDDDVLQAKMLAAGLRIKALSEYYTKKIPQSAIHTFVVNYANLEETEIKLALQRLEAVLLSVSTSRNSVYE